LERMAGQPLGECCGARVITVADEFEPQPSGLALKKTVSYRGS
jgi:hypothetical protein